MTRDLRARIGSALVAHQEVPGLYECTCCRRVSDIERHRADVVVALVRPELEQLAQVYAVLRESGIEHPLGAAGVRDLAAQRQGYLDRATAAEADLAIAEQHIERGNIENERAWREARIYKGRAENAEGTLAAVREYLELSDDDGIRTREHLLGLLDPAGVPSVIAAELGEDLPELTPEDAVEAMEGMAGELYRAEDRLAFVREMCDLADREQRQVTTEQVRAWANYEGCANATPNGAELARSLGFALAAMLPGAEPVFCHHEGARHSSYETHQAGWGRKTVQTVFCPTCKARAESTEGEPVLAPTVLNTERCTQACTERHTNGPGCLMAPDWSKPIRRSEP